MLVSTDDRDIAAAAGALGADVPFLRPQHLAGDDTPMLDVLRDLVDSLERREAYRPDILVLLQPTSPFRRAEQIDAAVDLLTTSDADSVVTVVPVPHRFAPGSLMQLDDDRLSPYLDGPAPMRRQDKPRLFARNGPAIVAVRTHVVTEQRTLYGPDTRAVVMAREDSLDIDDVFDLELAELLLTGRAGRNVT